MIDDRERAITRTFVLLARSFAEGYDVADLLHTLTAHSAELLDVAVAGLLLADDKGVLHVFAASNQNAQHLEVFQVQQREGPCLDCYLSGEPILVPDLSAETTRWPSFVAGAQAAGFASVHSLPMRLRSSVLGAVGLFGNDVGALNDNDLSLGQAMADAASAALVLDRAAADTTILNEQLQSALSSRVLIEQAKGLLAQLGNLDMDEAFAVLRRYVRDHNEKLGPVAQALVARELPTQALLDHAFAKGVLHRP